jgi:hypothetical protein
MRKKPKGSDPVGIYRNILKGKISFASNFDKYVTKDLNKIFKNCLFCYLLKFAIGF